MGMDFYMWLVTIKHFAQTAAVAKILYDNLGSDEKAAFKSEYENSSYVGKE